VCTDELGIPNWVLAPLVRYVHRAGREASAMLQRAEGRRVPPLRTSVHAGEDFVHLQTGLRHVDEAVWGFEMAEGDRIRPGLPLGVDPAEWALRAGVPAVRREVRWFDLAWEGDWYGQEKQPPPPGRIASLERELARLCLAIFGQRWSPE